MKRNTKLIGITVVASFVLALLSACGLIPTAVNAAAPSGATEATAVVEPIPPQNDLDTEETPPESDPATGPRIYAGGTNQTLIMPGCFDLDQGVVSGPPDPECDLQFVPGSAMESIDLYPVNRSQLGFSLPEVPLSGECSTAGAFSGEMLSLDPRSDRAYQCFQTGAGRIGWMRFTAADLGAAGSVTFEWQTFVAEDAAKDDSLAPSGQAGDELTYTHKGFGFQLAFPPAWSGYEVTEFPGKEVHNICFFFPASSPICVLQIDVYTHEVWAGLEKVHLDYLLAENDRFVFAAGPFTPECVQLDEFQCVRYQEISGILDRFTWE